NAKIEVHSDLVAAVRATASEPSLVCILGTGSNTCYFDGQHIHFGFDSLGYSIMDEASGNYFGKQLLRDFFYNKMPSHLSNRFAAEYDVTTEQVLLHLYKKPMPAKYLASFAKFIFQVGLADDYIQSLLEICYEELIEYKSKIWPEYKNIPIHFIGSIAYFAQDNLRYTITSKYIIAGRLLKAPIQRVYTYHIGELTN